MAYKIAVNFIIQLNIFTGLRDLNGWFTLGIKYVYKAVQICYMGLLSPYNIAFRLWVLLNSLIVKDSVNLSLVWLYKDEDINIIQIIAYSGE